MDRRVRTGLGRTHAHAPACAAALVAALAMLVTACGAQETGAPLGAPPASGHLCAAPTLASASLAGVSCTELVIEGTDLACGGGHVAIDSVDTEVLAVADSTMTVRMPPHVAANGVSLRVETDFGVADAVLDIVGSSCGGAFLWNRAFDTPSFQHVTRVARDSAGNLVIVGAYQGALDLGGGPLPAPPSGKYNGFVVKLDPHGGHLWDRVFPLSEAAGLAIDGHDDAIVGFGGDTTLAKLDSSGALVWRKSFPWVIAKAVAVGADDSIAVTGKFMSAVSLGGETFPPPQADCDMFVAKYAADGTHLWSSRFGDFAGATGNEVEPQIGRAITVGALGHIVVGADVYGEVDFGGGPLVSHGAAGWADVAFAAFTADGQHLWSGIYGGPGAERVDDLVAMETGVIAVGNFNSRIDFGVGEHVTGPMPGYENWAVGEDIFVVRFDPQGQALWSRQYGTLTYPEEVTAVARDGDGVVLTGHFRVNLDFGGRTLVNTGYLVSMFVARLGGAGEHTYSTSFSGEMNVYGNGVTLAESGPVVVGEYSAPVDFGGGALPFTDPDDYANLYVLGLLR